MRGATLAAWIWTRTSARCPWRWTRSRAAAWRRRCSPPGPMQRPWIAYRRRFSPRIGLVAHPVDQAGQDNFAEKRPARADRRPFRTSPHDLGLRLQAHSRGVAAAIGDHPISSFLSRRRPASPLPSGGCEFSTGAPSTLVVNHTRPLPSLLSNEQLRSGFGGRAPDFELPYIKGMARAMALGELEGKRCPAPPAPRWQVPAAAARLGRSRGGQLARRSVNGEADGFGGFHQVAQCVFGINGAGPHSMQCGAVDLRLGDVRRRPGRIPQPGG